MKPAELSPAAAGFLEPHIHLPVARILHWAVAVLVFGMFASGLIMTQLGSGPVADFLFTAHKFFGMTVLILMVVRLAYRVAAQLKGRWRRDAGSHPAHQLLYVAAVLTPLLGWAGVSDYGARGTLFGLTLPALIPEGSGYADALFLAHTIAATLFMAIVFWHVAIALRDYITRDGEVARPRRDPPAG